LRRPRFWPGPPLIPVSLIGGAVKVKDFKIISDNASNRATSYELSNKIITAAGKIFVAWLDGDQHCRVETYNPAS